MFAVRAAAPEERVSWGCNRMLLARKPSHVLHAWWTGATEIGIVPRTVRYAEEGLRRCAPHAGAAWPTWPHLPAVWEQPCRKAASKGVELLICYLTTHTRDSLPTVSAVRLVGRHPQARKASTDLEEDGVEDGETSTRSDSALDGVGHPAHERVRDTRQERRAHAAHSRSSPG